MKTSFYRKYRPQNFSQIIGQTNIVKILIGALKSESIAHAYLFSGPRGSGKTTTARILAKTINCTGKKAPCEKCDNCINITQGKSLDIIELDAASNRGIDEIKQIIEKINYAPSQGKYKVYIIDEAHMLTKEAFNALLKTLEEPPVHAVFILATTEIHKIPPTILSRCQRMDFKRSSHADLKKYIKYIADSEKLSIDDGALNMIADAADGSLRDSATLLEQIASISLNKITKETVEFSLGLVMQKEILDFIENIFSGDLKNALKNIEDITYSGYNIGLFIQKNIEFLRKFYLDFYNIEGIVLTDEEKEFIDKYKKSINPIQLVACIKIFSDAQEKTSISYISQLPLETSVFEIANLVFENKNLEPRIQKLEKKHIKKNQNNVETMEKSSSPTESSESNGNNQAVISTLSSNEEKSPVKNTNEISQSPSSFEKTKSPNPLANQSLTIDNLITNWLNILAEVKKVNHSLISLLANVAPIVLKQDKIIFATKYKFSAQKLSETSKKRLFEDVLKTIYGADFIAEFRQVSEKTKAIFNENNQKIKKLEQEQEEGVVTAAKEVFGI
jgi:DNA polymerase-3 subunit gamma/tau